MRKREKEIDHLVEEYFRYDHKTGIIYNKIKRSDKLIANNKSGCLYKDGYIYIGINYRIYLAHRLAWRLYYKTWPKNQIDHINGNKSDNRICNLRDVTGRENCQNRTINRCGKLLGYSYKKKQNTYSSSIKIGQIAFFVGNFKTPLEAHKQYKRALKAIKQRDFKSAKELRDYLLSTKK